MYAKAAAAFGEDEFLGAKMEEVTAMGLLRAS
jgi:hypothetical protein